MPCSMVLRSKVSWKNMHMSMTTTNITIIMMTNVAAVMIMITTMRSMSIITNMMRTAPADATIMTMNTIMITTMKSMSIIMNMMRTAPADAMTIITDTNMAKAGVSRVGLEKLGGQVLCFMADPDIAQRAKNQGSTRAVAAMQKAAQAYPGAILAVGNAPTALFEIVRQMERGFRPALVIGVPVGFVNVVEAKEAVLAA